MSKFLIVTHLVFFVVLALLIVGQHFYTDSLFAISIDMTKYLQRNRSNGLDIFMFSLKLLGASPLYVGMFVVIYGNFKKTYSFFYLAYFCILTALMGFLKNYYAKPRPFWVDKDIEALGCTVGFGNPSGHSMFVAGQLLIYWLGIFNPTSTDGNDERVRRCRSNKIIKIVTLFFFIVFMIVMGLSRIYLGGPQFGLSCIWIFSWYLECSLF